MTKTYIIGEEKDKNKEKKDILFVYILERNLQPERSKAKPVDFDNVTLIKRKTWFGLDLMAAFNNRKGEKHLFLGHWNDGTC